MSTPDPRDITERLTNAFKACDCDGYGRHNMLTEEQDEALHLEAASTIAHLRGEREALSQHLEETGAAVLCLRGERDERANWWKQAVDSAAGERRWRERTEVARNAERQRADRAEAREKALRSAAEGVYQWIKAGAPKDPASIKALEATVDLFAPLLSSSPASKEPTPDEEFCSRCGSWRGIRFTLGGSKEPTCPTCDDKAVLAGVPQIWDGADWIPCRDPFHKPASPREPTCDRCGGSGAIIEKPDYPRHLRATTCPDCGGSGRASASEGGSR